MAKVRTVWGIDIGQCALKALKVVDFEGILQVVDFDIIEHPEILSQPDVDKGELIRQSLEQFLSRHSTQGATIALAVPGQSSFTRFFKPPPVDIKELPRIVQYEAAQQIPFAIEEVVWEWQAFTSEDSPDIEVGIFAMKRQDIAEALAHLSDVGLHADVVQVAPLAVYNFVTFDEQAAAEGATLVADVGADKTDLIVVDGSKLWTRTIQIGGNNFTEALARAFKLSFAKAEKLKRTAATSKYARQVFQAMRPVFADLVQEIQRSVGYYISLHRESTFTKLLGLGNGFRLPGLQKFLEQNLQFPVTRLDSFKQISPAEGVNVPGFGEGVLSFAVAYGLAAQVLRPTRVTTNLLPEEIARRRLWVRKIPWFAATAAALLLSLGVPTYRAFADSRSLPSVKKNPAVLSEAKSTVRRLENLRKEYNKVKDAGRAEQQQIDDYFAMLAYREVWPAIHAMIGDSIRSITAGDDGRDVQALLAAYARAADDGGRKRALEAIGKIKRSARRAIIVQTITASYAAQVGKRIPRELLDNATAPTGRGFVVTMVGRTPMPIDETILRLERMRHRSKQIAGALPAISVLACNIQTSAGRPPVESADGEALPISQPDPLLPDEDMAGDSLVMVTWYIAIDTDGQPGGGEGP
ncbi:hypothetical protein LCGC14_0125020 [marine sediment metagenome]|uniref:SHS2 domain-containing protein n=1 Tax=marine sediment metagenome TaxID=412755 RepID=A0A0F9VLG8_9ZZZZ|nr:type IV pilus assembly protein PilM [Phycisphaerae bacterium]HDZ45334.1 type IV pilus assembly protein PilM [Phycisphaerae bacterium]